MSDVRTLPTAGFARALPDRAMGDREWCVLLELALVELKSSDTLKLTHGSGLQAFAFEEWRRRVL